MAKTDTSKDPYIEGLEQLAAQQDDLNQQQQSDKIGDIREVKGKTENHQRYIRLINEKSIVLCYGVAGSGKTSISCGVAANLIKSGKYERIIITRPIVESGEKLGFLPGSVGEKQEPYLIPLWEEFKNYISMDLFRKWHHNSPKILEAIPIAYLRGRNFHNSIIIVDEAANCTIEQLKLVITRLGNNSKLIINGDVKQSDLQHWQKGGFATIINKLRDSRHVGIVKFGLEDVVRSGVLRDILELLDD